MKLIDVDSKATLEDFLTLTRVIVLESGYLFLTEGMSLPVT
jgi:hypothetical protein